MVKSGQVLQVRKKNLNRGSATCKKVVELVARLQNFIYKLEKRFVVGSPNPNPNPNLLIMSIPKISAGIYVKMQKNGKRLHASAMAGQSVRYAS